MREQFEKEEEMENAMLREKMIHEKKETMQRKYL
jgi:hypothetical protein